jgi:hypothetical protein
MLNAVAAVVVVAASFGFLVLLVARMLDESGGRPEWLSNVCERLRPLKAWHFLGVAVVAAALAISSNLSALLLALLGLAAVVVYTVGWCREFLFLMGLRDDDFSGQFDKPIWAFVLVVTGPVGLWIFRTYRAAHWPSSIAPVPEPRPAKPSHAPDLL